jgi:UDP-glucose 4-epimerase
MRNLGGQGRRVLVTGADGFIGSHVAESFTRHGFDVHALCLYNSFGSHGWLDSCPPDVLKDMTVHLGDVRDAGRMLDLIAGVDVVVHLAALIAIPYSYQAPSSFVDTNVLGTLNVLEGARRSGATKVILTSTSEVYGTPHTVPITEDHPLQAQSPYAASKVGADQLGMSYAASFDLDVAILRPFNTYGPRQSMRAVIPTVLTQLVAGAETIRLGSLSPRRDFTFVSDTVDGFLRLATTQTSSGIVVQLGTGTSVSIGELVELAKELTGSSAEVLEDAQRVRPERSEVQVLLSDPTRAELELGWRPKVTLADGLRETVDWLQKNSITSDVQRYHR